MGIVRIRFHYKSGLRAQSQRRQAGRVYANEGMCSQTRTYTCTGLVLQRRAVYKYTYMKCLCMRTDIRVFIYINICINILILVRSRKVQKHKSSTYTYNRRLNMCTDIQYPKRCIYAYKKFRREKLVQKGVHANGYIVSHEYAYQDTCACVLTMF